MLCDYVCWSNESKHMYQQISSYSGGQSARHMSGGMSSRPVDDPRIVGMDPGTSAKDRALGLGGGRPEVPLPPDASSTLFVEGLPSDCSRREVARILSLATRSMLVFNAFFLYCIFSFTWFHRYLSPFCWLQRS